MPHCYFHKAIWKIAVIVGFCFLTPICHVILHAQITNVRVNANDSYARWDQVVVLNPKDTSKLRIGAIDSTDGSLCDFASTDLGTTWGGGSPHLTVTGDVALKFLSQYFTSNPNEKERFYHEARAAFRTFL